ncbi:MAG: hypothetical protein AAGF46_11405, partial [Pseudomonadota bacterium]
GPFFLGELGVGHRDGTALMQKQLKTENVVPKAAPAPLNEVAFFVGADRWATVARSGPGLSLQVHHHGAEPWQIGLEQLRTTLAAARELLEGDGGVCADEDS